MKTPDGEGWVQCGCGARHWGRYGAAGLLLADGPAPEQVVLQHRAPWSHFGGTWGIPGGAREAGESAVAAALREAGEEAGLDPARVRPHAAIVLAHPDWSYTTVVALPAEHTGPDHGEDHRGRHRVHVRATDAESVAVQWRPVEDLQELDLLPAFGESVALLLQMLTVAPVLIVDAANVVGSRPDGWWRDRHGATTRLVRHLEALASRGIRADLLDLPGQTWWPQVVVVTEGAARGVQADDPVQVIDAPGEGDDEVLDAVVRAMRTPPGVRAAVTVVTADRGLRERVEAAGGQCLGPGTLWRAIEEDLRPGS